MRRIHWPIFFLAAIGIYVLGISLFPSLVNPDWYQISTLICRYIIGTICVYWIGDTIIRIIRLKRLRRILELQELQQMSQLHTDRIAAILEKLLKDNGNGTYRIVDQSIGDPYAVLGLPRSATDEDIKKAYRKLAKKYHPDLNPSGDHNRFREITEAYSLLIDNKN